jgi:hypothetical protein
MAGPVGWRSPDNHTCNFMSHPLIKAVCRNPTASGPDRISERCRGRDRLRPRVDGLRAEAGISGPRRNQAPSDQRQLAEVGSLAYDWHRLSRSDVVARLPVILEGNCVKVLGDDLLTARELVAATHDLPMIFSYSLIILLLRYDGGSSQIFPPERKRRQNGRFRRDSSAVEARTCEVGQGDRSIK